MGECSFTHLLPKVARVAKIRGYASGYRRHEVTPCLQNTQHKKGRRVAHVLYERPCVQPYYKTERVVKKESEEVRCRSGGWCMAIIPALE
jgi:hypothetical protein